MSDREKLIEFVDMAEKAADEQCWNEESCEKCGKKSKDGDKCYIGLVVDILISNGVTVQKWIPVSERLPQEEQPEISLCDMVQILLSDNTVTVGWCNRYEKNWYFIEEDNDYFTKISFETKDVVAWKPLSEPPKECE